MAAEPPLELGFEPVCGWNTKGDCVPEAAMRDSGLEGTPEGGGRGEAIWDLADEGGRDALLLPLRTDAD